MLQLNQVSKEYRMGDVSVKALDGVSLSIEAGDFVAIMGPSGSGKSSLMNILGLLDTPDSGSYQVEGCQTTELSTSELARLRGLSIGFIFQQFHLLPHFSAMENVLLPQLYAPHGFDAEAGEHLLNLVGLQPRKNHKPNELSGGQQQRVAIARAMINKPRLLLADEPTGNLDSASEEDIMKQLQQLNQQGVTVVIVTHEEHIGSQAKRLIRMRDGRIQSDERLNQFHPVALSQRGMPAMPGKGIGDYLASLKLQTKQAFANLKGNKLRTLLSTLGITIGVGSVVAMISFGGAFKQSIDEQISFMGRNMVLVEPGKTPDGRNEPLILELGVQDQLKRQLSRVKQVTPIQIGQALVTFDRQARDTRILGVGTNFFQSHSMQALSGRLFDEDTRPEDRVVVLGEELAEELFPNDPPVGAFVRVNGTEFEVIGVLKKSQMMQMYGERDALIVPIESALKRINGNRELSMLEVEGDDLQNPELLAEQVKDTMGLIFNIPASATKTAFRTINVEGMRKNVERIGLAVSFFLALVASVSLFVGGIGIMNIMLVSVTERTREIGLRKAIGATEKAIFLQFLTESKIVCLAGGLLGSAIAIGLCLIVSAVMPEFQVKVMLGTVVFACGFSMLVGILSGLYPARRAARLNPIDALRSL